MNMPYAPALPDVPCPLLGPGTRVTRAAKQAEANSKFRQWQFVRACKQVSWNRDGYAARHSHQNPDHHFDSRVLWWDEDGRIVIALPARADPHLAMSAYDEALLAPRDDVEWVPHSSVKPNQRIRFRWEEVGFATRKGELVAGVVAAPHTQPGDWLVYYPSQGAWRTRVLHEGKMILR